MRNIFWIILWTLNVKTMGSLYNKVELRWHRNRPGISFMIYLSPVMYWEYFIASACFWSPDLICIFFSCSSVLQIIYGCLKYVFGVGFFGGVITTWLSYMIKVVLNFCLVVGCRNMVILRHLPKSRCVVQTD